MNVLHISYSDAGGGAARSAYRLHSTLRAHGHASRMLVGRVRRDDPDVRSIKRNLAWRAADRAAGSIADPLGLQYVFYPSSFGVASDPWFREADVVQLFNTHGSYFSHTALPLLSRRRPIVWRLSDMWPLTGHVAYSYECERWRVGCGQCPYLHEYPKLPRDTTRLLFRIKDAVYRHSRIIVVAPSAWIERIAAESPLLSRFPRVRIPNGVDLDRFRTQPKPRRERPVVLFSAPDPEDRRKGGHILEEVRARVGVEYELAAFNGGESELARQLAEADVFLLPTLADNLPNMAIESMACGTPVVAFDVGGVGDAVRHLETGWLAPAGDTEALAAGVRSLLEDAELRERLGRGARAVAEAEYGADLEAKRFAELYEGLVA